MSALGIAGTVVFLLFGMGGLSLLYMFPRFPNDSLFPASVVFIFIGITIGILDSELSKESRDNSDSDNSGITFADIKD